MGKFLMLFIAALFFVFLGALIINLWIVGGTKHLAYSTLDDLPQKDVALILGTARSPDGRQMNEYFYFRVKAAYELYKAKKVRHFILSGDNHHEKYNEPRDMQALLMDFGVPEEKITLDYAGFRTLDSVVRSKKVFGQNNICIVSQAFHTPRALFIARYFDIDGVAYNADVNEQNVNYQKLILREYLARVKAFLDLYILRTQPRFLGEKETITF